MLDSRVVLGCKAGVSLHKALLLMVVAAATGCSSSPERIIVAHVNDDVIRAGELKTAISEVAGDFSPEIMADPEGLEAVKEKVLKGLVQERLLLQKADQKKIELSTEELNQATRALTEGYTQATLQKILEARHIRYEDWLKKQQVKARIDKLLHQEIYRMVAVEPAEAEDYFQKNRKSFREPDRIHCLHIVAGKRDKAQKIRSLLEKGENFSAVARQYSESPDRDQGGDLGYVARGDYPGLFEQACFTLALGQTSDVIPSEYGFHIFRVIEKKPGHGLSMQEALPEIEKQLKEEKGRAQLRAWLEVLFREAKISIDEKAVQAVSIPGAAVPETMPKK